MEILASRILLRPTDYQRSLRFYRDEIGLAIARDYGAGTVFYAGQSLIELAGHGNPDKAAAPFPGALWLQVRDVAARKQILKELVVLARADGKFSPAEGHTLEKIRELLLGPATLGTAE